MRDADLDPEVVVGAQLLARPADVDRERAGEDVERLLERVQVALDPRRAGQGRPLMVVAHTVKGKGVSFMENKLEWHYRNVDAALLEQALDEVGRE